MNQISRPWLIGTCCRSPSWVQLPGTMTKCNGTLHPASLETVVEGCIESFHLVFGVREGRLPNHILPCLKCETEGLWVLGPSVSHPMVELWVDLVSNKMEFKKENVQFLGMGSTAHSLTSSSFLGPAHYSYDCTISESVAAINCGRLIVSNKRVFLKKKKT